MRFKFERDIYPKVALLKASYNYTDKAFIHLDADDKYYFVEIEMKEPSEELSEKEFLNEMLSQTIRHEVYLQTRNIRELMLARAMATTIITETDVNCLDDDTEGYYNENEILKDWFSENGDINDKG